MAKSKQEKQLLVSTGKLSKDTGLTMKQSEELINMKIDLEQAKLLRVFYDGSKASIGVLLKSYEEPLKKAIEENNLDELKSTITEMLMYCKAICNISQEESEMSE